MATIIDIKLPKAIAAALRIPPNDPRRQQLRVLKKLLKKARFTEFGQKYHFDEAPIVLSLDYRPEFGGHGYFNNMSIYFSSYKRFRKSFSPITCI
jgi:hypothetical protein